MLPVLPGAHATPHAWPLQIRLVSSVALNPGLCRADGKLCSLKEIMAKRAVTEAQEALQDVVQDIERAKQRMAEQAEVRSAISCVLGGAVKLWGSAGSAVQRRMPCRTTCRTSSVPTGSC